MRIAHRSRALLLFALCAMTLSAQRRGGGFTPPDGMQFRFVAPAVGNRISAIAAVPGDPTTYYAGAASGGVWKSTDSARTFVPVFDAQPVQAIGALTLAPSNPKILWAGTGEAWAI